MEYSTLQAFMTVLLAICGGVVGIAGAVAVVVKFWKWAHRDTEQNTEDIGEFRAWLASDKRRIESLEARQAETEEMNRLQLEALFSLLGHEIDGNHTAQLEEVRADINKYLIKKVGGGR